MTFVSRCLKLKRKRFTGRDSSLGELLASSAFLGSFLNFFLMSTNIWKDVNVCYTGDCRCDHCVSDKKQCYQKTFLK